VGAGLRDTKFVGAIEAFDDAGKSLTGPAFFFAGLQTSTPDGSALFIGLLSTDADISSIRINAGSLPCGTQTPIAISSRSNARGRGMRKASEGADCVR
jgi:hypothetical protein